MVDDGIEPPRDGAQAWIAQQVPFADRRIRHDRDRMACAAFHERPFDAAFAEVIQNLIHRAVIAIGQRSIRRHVRYMRQMGLMARFAGERSLNMSVAETASGERTLERMIEVGSELRDADGADVIVMGCAGMARHRRPLEAALGVPVVDPTQAAVAMAIGAVQFA